MSTESPEQQIKARLRADDPSALALIWDHHADELLAYLVSILCCQKEAEDTLQDLFVKIAGKRQAVAESKSLRPYLYRMARNLAFNHIRSRERARNRETQAATWLFNTESETRDAESIQLLQTALAALPVCQRRVIVLRFYLEKSFREIGEALEISEHTARSRYRYGLGKLRLQLAEVAP